MTFDQIIQRAKEHYEQITPKQQALAVVTMFRVLYSRTVERQSLTDDFYLWYAIKYMNPEPLISTICPPAEKEGPFKRIQSSPVKAIDNEGDCKVCPEEEAEFWSVYVFPMDEYPVYLADCETKEIAIELETQVQQQLARTGGFTFTAGDLLRATALSLFAMQKV